MVTKLIKKKRDIPRIKQETTKKMIFIPEINIKTDQLKKINNVCPISGCAANNNATPKVIRKG